MIKTTILTSILFLMLNEITLFDFTANSAINEWTIVEDRVMGGRSNAQIRLTKQGHALFTGNVSLENNGGFASVQHRTEIDDVQKFSSVKIRLKGDGKNYQFRLKSNLNDQHSYIQEFSTNGEWQEIQIDLSKMYPAFRGNTLEIPNWDHDVIREITFLIGNKRNEEFSLLVDYIKLN